jgi:hypothetical protein
MIDIRCGASLDEFDHGRGRCQLLMGHEGRHAVMFGRSGHLEVRTWRVPGGGDVSDHIAAAEMRPWARGFPRPAWTEPVRAPALETSAYRSR